MSDRKNAFKAGASKFEDLKRPKKLIDVSTSEIEAAGAKVGFTRDSTVIRSPTPQTHSRYRAPTKRQGEKRVSLALSKSDYKWLSMYAIESERSLQSILEELVQKFRKSQEHNQKT